MTLGQFGVDAAWGDGTVGETEVAVFAADLACSLLLPAAPLPLEVEILPEQPESTIKNTDKIVTLILLITLDILTVECSQRNEYAQEIWN